jgi:hypothetical protein
MTRARGSGLLKEIGHAAWRVTATLVMVGEGRLSSRAFATVSVRTACKIAVIGGPTVTSDPASLNPHIRPAAPL